MGATENAQAGSKDGGMLPLDEDAEGMAVATQDGIDEAAIIHGLIVPFTNRHRRQRGATSVAVAVARARVVVIVIVIVVAVAVARA